MCYNVYSFRNIIPERYFACSARFRLSVLQASKTPSSARDHDRLASPRFAQSLTREYSAIDLHSFDGLSPPAADLMLTVLREITVIKISPVDLVVHLCHV